MEKKLKVYLGMLIGIVMCMMCVSSGDMLTAYAATYTYGDFTYILINNDTEIEITGYNGSDTELVIPGEIEGKTVTGIEDDAFYKCSNLTSITIPASVTSIGYYAFDGCSGLSEISIAEGNSRYKSIDGILYELYDKVCYSIRLVPAKKIGTVKIQEGVREIDRFAFRGCSNLTSIEIPTSVTSIESSAFSGCSSLASISIPEGVTSIGYGAFSGCSGLTSIEIPASVTSIEEHAFDGTPWLENKQKENPLVVINHIVIDGSTCSGDVTIPDDVTSILDDAFYECSSLKSIKIPASVTSIGSSAFEGCSNLTNISILEGVTSIGSSAFSGCSNLTSIEIPASVTSIGYRAFDGCSGLSEISIAEGNPRYKSIDGILYDKECTHILLIPVKKIGTVQIPEGVTSIGSSAFSGCSGLTSVSIPEGVTSIGFSAFRDCNSLTSISIPKGVTAIEYQTFSGCSNLTNIEIPESVTNIYYNAFDGTPWLENKRKDNPLVVINHIVIDGSTCSGDVTIPDDVISILDDAFYGCSKLTSIKIPVSVTSIGYNAFYGCSSLSEISIAEGNLNYKSIDGVLYDEAGTELLFVSRKKTGVVNIQEGVRQIWNYAFYGCGSITGITMPASVTSIGGMTSMGRDVFDGCSGLMEIVVAEGNPRYKSVDGVLYRILSKDEVGDSEYDEILLVPPKKESVCIPKDMTKVYTTALKTSGLKEITVEEGSPAYKSIDGILYDKEAKTILCVPCGKKGEINIPEGVETIGWGAFRNCSEVAKVEIPSGVTTIGHYAFEGCSGLTEIVIPEGVETIGSCAFVECHNLKKIEIPASVTGIRENAEDWSACSFSDCSSLEEIIVHSGNKKYESIDGALYVKDRKALLCVPGGKEGIFCIPEGTEEIIRGAFLGCNKLTATEVPASVLKLDGSSADIGYSDGRKVLDFIVIPDSYAETYAKENNIPYTYSGAYWTVTIKNSSGQVVKTLRVNKGGILAAPQPSEEQTDKTFLGFFNGDNKFDFSKPITGNVTLTEKWEEKKDNPETPVTPPQESGIILSREVLFFDSIGITQTLAATVAADAADKTVTWASSDDKVATVADGVVTSVGNGSAVITARTAEGKTATATVTVSQKTVKLSIQLKGQTVSGTLKARVKKSYSFKAVVTPSNADAKNAKVTWSSSNKKIATVNSKGKVTIKKTGKVTITAKTADGRKAVIKLNAVKKAVKITKLKITGSKTMKVKAKQVLKIKVVPVTADNQKVTWKSSNKKIATVNSKGVVTAKKAGKVTITATAKDGSRKKATFKITVKR